MRDRPHLYAIPGVIHLRDRRVQADRQAVSKFLNKGSHSLVNEVILSGFKMRAVKSGGLAQFSGALQRAGIGNQQRNDVLELAAMGHVGFRNIAGNTQIMVRHRAELFRRANAPLAIEQESSLVHWDIAN